MKSIHYGLLSSMALLLGACSAGPWNSVNPGFRHPVLRSLEAEPRPWAGVSWEALSPAPGLRQRCLQGFRHPALNRCQLWLEDDSVEDSASAAALPACRADRGDCRLALSASAREMLTNPRWEIDGQGFGRDCAGFVMAVLASVGIDLAASLPERKAGEGGVSLLYRMARQRGLLHRHKVPQIGDLVFFDNTWDRDQDGRPDDLLTHVGIVERVDADGTVTFIHHVRRGVLRYRLNLFHPSQRRDPTTHKVLNHHLRLGSGSDDLRLTGELHHAFASLLP